MLSVNNASEAETHHPVVLKASPIDLGVSSNTEKPFEPFQPKPEPEATSLLLLKFESIFPLSAVNIFLIRF